MRHLEGVLSQSATSVPRFPATSRYATTKIATTTGLDGRQINYLRRRFVPPPERFAVVGVWQVEQGDRIDLLAHRHLGDVELYWRICDANRALRPDELTETVSRRLRLTLPEGVPGEGERDA
jgi:hypothetical protein